MCPKSASPVLLTLGNSVSWEMWQILKLATVIYRTLCQTDYIHFLYVRIKLKEVTDIFLMVKQFSFQEKGVLEKYFTTLMGNLTITSEFIKFLILLMLMQNLRCIQ